MARALTNGCSRGDYSPGWCSCATTATRATTAAGHMLSYEYKLQVTPAQQAAIDEAIRVAQFIRNKCLRLWMDGQSITANDLQIACSRLAHEFAFASRLNSQARQAAADRAWAAIGRFYANCTAQRPGKKGYPCFRHDCRSVEYKDTGWRLDPDGKHLTFTDGCGIGRVKLIGTRDLATFSSDQFKRVRLIRRADGYYAQVVIAAARRVTHVPTGKVVGIDMGLNVSYTDSTGHAVDNPRFIQAAEPRLRWRSRHLAKSISDASWARFRQWVEYYGQVQGIPVIAVPPHYTSEACSRCGRRVHKSLSVRTHVCRCVPMSVRGAAWSWTETTTRRAT